MVIRGKMKEKCSNKIYRISEERGEVRIDWDTGTTTRSIELYLANIKSGDWILLKNRWL